MEQLQNMSRRPSQLFPPVGLGCGKAGLAPKAMLRANGEIGNIQLDSETQLAGVSPEAWTYKLGNRSVLEWVLDQHKEKTPKDPTIREKFNTIALPITRTR